MPTYDDPYVAQLKARKQALQLELKAINNEMASIRARYSQRRSSVFRLSRWGKDRKLRKLQPQKERLQQEILALQTQIANL